MKNILARGGIEFLAVLLGISGSLWVDDYRIELANQEKTIITVESLKKELEKQKLELAKTYVQLEWVWCFFGLFLDIKMVDL